MIPQLLLWDGTPEPTVRASLLGAADMDVFDTDAGELDTAGDMDVMD